MPATLVGWQRTNGYPGPVVALRRTTDLLCESARTLGTKPRESPQTEPAPLPQLTLPHPELSARAIIVTPLAQFDASWRRQVCRMATPVATPRHFPVARQRGDIIPREEGANRWVRSTAPGFDSTTTQASTGSRSGSLMRALRSTGVMIFEGSAKLVWRPFSCVAACLPFCFGGLARGS